MGTETSLCHSCESRWQGQPGGWGPPGTTDTPTPPADKAPGTGEVSQKTWGVFQGLEWGPSFFH